jgi:hypothetical protein
MNPADFLEKTRRNAKIHILRMTITPAIVVNINVFHPLYYCKNNNFNFSDVFSFIVFIFSDFEFFSNVIS